MIIVLHSLLLSLQSSSDLVKKQWQTLFDFEISRATVLVKQRRPDIVLETELVSHLPPAPSYSPSFCAIEPPLAVFRNETGEILLRWSNRAEIRLDIAVGKADQSDKPMRAHILLTDHSLHDASFEDITMFALAPLLRRYDLFLIHAFSAAFNDQAVLFVGPSGSGKTSSGLALTGAGWQLLANDVALLRQESDAPLAYLSPGTVHVSAATFSLLPRYRRLLAEYAHGSSSQKIAVPRHEFLLQEPIALSAQIKDVFFPEVSSQEEHRSKTVPRGIGLARLMESSMDQWDQASWETHIEFLERLSQKVRFHSLYLGSNMLQLPGFIENIMTEA